MGTSSKGGNEAKLARQDEQARQERIRSGTDRINSIFDGGVYGTGAVETGSTYDPNATYYMADGSVWSPTSSTTTDARGQPVTTSGASFDDMVKKGQLFTGTATGTGFNDDFFTGRRQAFLDYATPQLEDQYQDANKQLAFALTRGGLLNSSARGEKTSELQKLYDLNMQDVADKALSHETESRNAVEDARSNLIATLNATGDAEGAASSAIARASALSQPAAYSPLGQLFAQFTSGLGVQAAQERAAAASGGSYSPRYDTGLFGGGGRVVVR